MKSNLLIKNKSTQKLQKLNEDKNTISDNGKYIFKGIFTQCSVPGDIHENRNERIYMADEFLRHLPYLRQKIKDDGCILGELDHPESRYDISLKEASHKITDLWYDEKSHGVYGKLELLDTPNGKIAKELIDSGYPMYVSSRAAGTVDEKTHEVEILQIFTYDIICTPGFKEARLDRVNESLSHESSYYLNESIKSQKIKTNDNKKYNIKNNNIEVYDCNESIEINEKPNNIKMKDIVKPLLEEDDVKDPINKGIQTEQDNNQEAAAKAGLEVKSLDPQEVKEDDGKKITQADNISEADDDKDKKDNILDIEPVEDNKEEENVEKKKSDIISIEGKKKDDEDEKKDDDKDKDEDEKKDDDKDKEDKDKEVKEDKEEQNKISKQAEDDTKKVDDLIAEIENKNKVKESIIQKFPFSISLSESNFNKFAMLNSENKNKCNNFIVEHQILDIKSINELWETPLNEEKKLNKNWLKLADEDDIKLFVSSPIEVQDAIEESAKYVILETKQDVEDFWARTGLRQQEKNKIVNEEFVKKYKDIINPNEINEGTVDSKKYIQMIEDMMLNS